MYIIFCILALLILLFILNNQTEGFMPLEYRTICRKPNHLTNIKELVANNWHLRFPYMVNQRYSYNDYLDYNPFPSLHEYAQLKELPLGQRDKILNIYGYDNNDYYDGSFSTDPL